MAPKTQAKSAKPVQKEEPKEEPAAATVTGAVAPNANKTVQGMSFLSMLKKNAAPEAAPAKEEKAPAPAPAVVDLPAAAAPAKDKKKKEKKEAAAKPVVEETPAPAPVEVVPEPVVEPVVEATPEPEVEEAAPVVEEEPVVEAAAPAAAGFNWADAGSDFTQFSSRTEILPATVSEPIVEKLTVPVPHVTFRTPFVPAPGLLFYAPSDEMLLSNRLAAIQQHQAQLLLREKQLESQAALDKSQKIAADKEVADQKLKLAADREALNRERNEFVRQQQHQAPSQSQPQSHPTQHLQHQHHHHHHHQHHNTYPTHSSHQDMRSTNWADDEFEGYNNAPAAPAPQYRGNPNANSQYRPNNNMMGNMHNRPMGGGGYPQQQGMYGQQQQRPMMPRQQGPPRPGPFSHHQHHHHQQGYFDQQQQQW